MTPIRSAKFRNVIWLAVLVLVACTTAPDTPAPTAAPTPTPAATDLPAVPNPTLAPRLPVTLTLWLPARWNRSPARDVLAEQLAAFAQSPDGTPVQVRFKADYGPGGLFDLLQAASPIAPGALPDVIALDETELAAAARSGLLQPIGPLLPADFVADFYPFARELGVSNGELYGLIAAADVTHLAIDPAWPQAAPTQWNQILTANQPYVFPLLDTRRFVSDEVLAHYLALGGTFTDTTGQPYLAEAILAQQLNEYRQAQQRGVLLDNALALDNPDRAWAAFRASDAGLGDIQASRYLSLSLDTLQFAPLPAFGTPAGAPLTDTLDAPDMPPAPTATAPIGRGWALAAVARPADARRQATVSRLLQWLLSPENSAAWTRTANTLPGRAAALAGWDQTQPYTGFVGEQLAAAQAAPATAVLNALGPAFAKAIQDVLSGRATPEEAAQIAVQSLSPAP